MVDGGTYEIVSDVDENYSECFFCTNLFYHSICVLN
jgi:hypothetical protein